MNSIESKYFVFLKKDAKRLTLYTLIKTNFNQTIAML